MGPTGVLFDLTKFNNWLEFVVISEGSDECMFTCTVYASCEKKHRSDEYRYPGMRCACAEFFKNSVKGIISAEMHCYILRRFPK
jgi:hypothetical protein